MENKKIIELKSVSKEYDGETVLDSIDLDIYDKEFVTLLGPSGCGKTTTLRIIGGFVKPDSGELLFDGVNVIDVPPHKRPVNTVFQKYALFPHLNVYDNIAFGLRLKKMPEKEIYDKVEEMLVDPNHFVGLCKSLNIRNKLKNFFVVSHNVSPLKIIFLFSLCFRRNFGENFALVRRVYYIIKKTESKQFYCKKFPFLEKNVAVPP